ncbi:MAG: lipoyl(octanoyl) transferase LipB [Acidobacteriota bacterium]|nr:lipoyl(octanoyl) transferase LipB [Acidobacteriota bacterium]
MNPASLHVRRLGLVPYAEALELQRRLVDDRKADRIPDTLLLLQHPHVVTIGVKKDGRSHILASPERLLSLGVEVLDTGRGGDVTYHGPGQLVGYPIVDLNPDRRDVHRYVRDLEEVMIRVCADYGLDAERLKGLSGTWIPSTRDARSGQVAYEKIGAIGVRISRWISSHGFAFNVTTDVEFFKLIVPCGIADRGVTSLSARIGKQPAMADVEDRIVGRFCEVFGRTLAA